MPYKQEVTGVEFQRIWERWSEGKWRAAAKESSLRRFPGDWVIEFVEGGEDYLFGYDMRECGIHKFWRSKGLEEFVPYLCLTDWAKWKSIGVAVERSQTIANGHEVCDFRYCRAKKACPSGWPPESNPEWTGKFERTNGDRIDKKTGPE